MLAADLDAFLPQKITQHPTTRERKFQVQLVDPPHDGEIGRRHRSGQIINAAPADPQLPGLPRQRQCVRTVDHRFALGNSPAFPSAPDKKSFTSVSSPILACSVFTSITGAAALLRVSLPNTPAAPSRSCPCHCVIWFGCTSNCRETINGLYKAEVVWRQRSWPSVSAVEMATLRWVDWYNNHRLFGPIGHIPPAEAEDNYYAALENLDMAA